MPRKKEMSVADKMLLEQVGKRIVDAIQGSLFDADGVHKVPVKYKTGNFKNKPLTNSISFFMSYAYVGASGKMIFGFSPEDSQEYQYAEIDEKKMDNVFPLVGSEVAAHFGFTSEKFQDCIADITAQIQKEQEEIERKETEVYLNNEGFGMF